MPAGPGEEAARTAGSQVDAVSSHVLVSVILSRMSERKPHDCEIANGSLNQLWYLRWWTATWRSGNSKANICTRIYIHGLYVYAHLWQCSDIHLASPVVRGCRSASVYVCIYVCMYMYVCIYIYVYICVCVCVCVCVGCVAQSV